MDRVVPDGCLELILHWGDSFAEANTVSAEKPETAAEANGFHIQPRVLIAGQRESPLFLRAPRHTGITAARFRPGGSMPFLHERIDAFSHRTVDLELVTKTGRELLERVASATHAAARMDLLESWLLRRLRSVPSQAKVVDRAVQILLRSEVMPDGSQLARLVGCSRRTLERHFRERVGIAPMALRRVLRLQSVFWRLQRETGISWSQVAAACGYYDQAHLVRDFRQYTGLTPTAWVREQHDLSDLFTQVGRLDQLLDRS